MEAKRLAWIDVAKGIGMITVVLGHCFNKETWIHNWIFSFHMPLFFWLSGYCFRTEKYSRFRELVEDKIRTLLIPYFKFWILGLFFTLLIAEWREELSLKQIFIDIYSGYPSSLHITSTWYLIALFMCEMIFYIIYKINEKIKGKWFLWLCIGLSGIIGYMVSVVKSIVYDSQEVMQESGNSVTFLPGNRLPLTLDTCLTAIVFFAIGYEIKKYRKTWVEGNKSAFSALSLLLANIAVGLGLNTRVNLHGCTYGNGVYFYFAALTGSMAVIYFSQIICGRKNKLFEPVRKFFVFYGENSLLMLGIQSLDINLFVYVLNKLTEGNYLLYENVPIRFGILAFALITVVFLPISKRINDRIGKTAGI